MDKTTQSTSFDSRKNVRIYTNGRYIRANLVFRTMGSSASWFGSVIARILPLHQFRKLSRATVETSRVMRARTKKQDSQWHVDKQWRSACVNRGDCWPLESFLCDLPQRIPPIPTIPHPLRHQLRAGVQSLVLPVLRQCQCHFRSTPSLTKMTMLTS